MTVEKEDTADGELFAAVEKGNDGQWGAVNSR